ncbi:MAG: hypothetical protein GKR91_02765 [Pseudomonadales bacterium]|nr:hypothetical protein [Pseudomonadales bacterium]
MKRTPNLNLCLSLASKILFLLSLAVGVNQVGAQNINLTPEQMAQLQALTPAQRQALLDSLSSPALTQEQIAEPLDVEPRARAPQTINSNAIERNFQIEQQADDADLAEEGTTPTNSSQLEQFGYSLFAGSPTTFAPATDIPVPANYVMGPGDNVIIQLYGQQNVTHELVITREGVLLLPEIGPIAVSGLSFDDLRAQIDEIVSTQLIGQQAAITLGNLRSIRIFVLGEAFRPGSYTVSGLSTMTNALFVSGGITNVGSLRNIQLRRQGETVAELDLYDLLLEGDTSADQRLLPDDVLFIPPIGPTVAVSGEVIRPAIYEIKDESTTLEVLMLAGGLLPTAYPQASRIERIDGQGLRTVVDVDLAGPLGQAEQVRNGDLIQINPVLDQLENVVITEGHLQRPGGFQWREDLRVSDVIGSISALLPNPDLNYALIVREQQPTRIFQVMKLSLGEALTNPNSDADLLLEPRDRIITFGATESREENLEDLIIELNEQASFDNLAALIEVQGNVRFPGLYPFTESMTVGDIVNSAGGMLENADSDFALVVRIQDNQGNIEVHDATTGTISIETNIAIERGDTLLVFDANEPRTGLLQNVINQLQSQADSAERSKIVQASGQVKFPGEYPLYDGMTVEGLIRSAGGLSESALTTEAEMTRYFVSGDSGRQIDHIDVNLISSTVNGRNLELREFDNLVLRQLPNWVEPEAIELAGEVVSPGTYSIAKGDSLSSVISRAGGLTSFADANASVLLRAELRERERELLAQYQEELESDIAAVALEEDGEDQGDVLSIGEDLIEQVEEADPLGRLVIDLPGLMAGNDNLDVIARNGDQLFIPRTRQEITILGEVNYPTSHVFDPALGVEEYINLSGGLTQRSDAGRTYIIKANGQVVTFGDSRWFFDRNASDLEAGDTIVVPFDIEPTDYFTTWASVSQILFNLATSVLAINSVQN